LTLYRPVFGKESLHLYLEEQRDIYKYIHDQALRLANHGHTPNEIAALIDEPDWLSEKFHARGYYGTLKFNARAVYQHYYGFFDGTPVNIDPLPPETLGHHIIQAVGGPEAALQTAKTAIEKDQLQWAATLLQHLVFSGLGDEDARALLAEVYRHLGYRAESGIMRNIYLTGAKELVDGVNPLPMAGGRNEDLAATLSLRDWFDAFALRLNPDMARGVDMALGIEIAGQDVSLFVTRQTEFARIGHRLAETDARLVIDQTLLEELAGGKITLEKAIAKGASISGNRDKVEEWLGMHDSFELWFNIVTP
jgi:alkyl sulfatase BDS1-like metallo-beta-lactamase superfamily hydrolase